MRKPEYLSPSNISLFYSDRPEWYLRYMAENRPPKIPQTQPMAIGSAFDAYIKSHLYKTLYKEPNPKYDFVSLFKTQVENHKEWALEHGQHAFITYRDAGCIADLMAELRLCTGVPHFEFTIQGLIKTEDFPEGVPVQGKPDYHVKINPEIGLTLDWKVNGYCSNYNTSPAKGYISFRDPRKGLVKKAHKDAIIGYHHGIMYNMAHPMESIDSSWAIQLAIYSWLLGEPIGGDFLVGIEQLVCNKNNGEYPDIRIASIRSMVSQDFQLQILFKINEVWKAINTGYIFTDLSYEDNKAKCKLLDDYHKAFTGTSENDKWYQEMMRGS